MVVLLQSLPKRPSRETLSSSEDENGGGAAIPS